MYFCGADDGTCCGGPGMPSESMRAFLGTTRPCGNPFEMTVSVPTPPPEPVDVEVPEDDPEVMYVFGVTIGIIITGLCGTENGCCWP